MYNRLAAGALVLGGLAILLVSLLADVLGPLSVGARLGIGQNPGFGSQQILGTIVGLVVLLVGVWLWQQGAEAKFRSVRYAIAALVFAVVVGGPTYLVAKRGLLQSAYVETCVEVETVPSPAEGAAQTRVNYGVRIVNTGKSRVYVDSVVLIAVRDSAEWWLSQSEVVAMEDVPWTKVDSGTVRPSSSRMWLLSTGDEFARRRSVLVPVEQLSSLYRFDGIVFLRHRDPGRPVLRSSAVDWLDNFPQECP